MINFVQQVIPEIIAVDNIIAVSTGLSQRRRILTVSLAVIQANVNHIRVGIIVHRLAIHVLAVGIHQLIGGISRKRVGILTLRDGRVAQLHILVRHHLAGHGDLAGPVHPGGVLVQQADTEEVVANHHRINSNSSRSFVLRIFVFLLIKGHIDRVLGSGVGLLGKRRRQQAARQYNAVITIDAVIISKHAAHVIVLALSGTPCKRFSQRSCIHHPGSHGLHAGIVSILCI